MNDDELEQDIKRFEAMSEEEVDAELERMHIDAGPTVASVLAIVRAKLEEWQRARLHLVKK